MVTGHGSQSFSNIPQDTAGDLKMHKRRSLRGQKAKEALIQSEWRRRGRAGTHCLGLVLPFPSFGFITVSPQVLTLGKVGQGKPALSCPLLW